MKSNHGKQIHPSTAIVWNEQQFFLFWFAFIRAICHSQTGPASVCSLFHRSLCNCVCVCICAGVWVCVIGVISLSMNSSVSFMVIYGATPVADELDGAMVHPWTVVASRKRLTVSFVNSAGVITYIVFKRSIVASCSMLQARKICYSYRLLPVGNSASTEIL